MRVEIKPAFSNSSRLKSDGLVWTEGVTVEIKARFQIPPARRGRGLRVHCPKTKKIVWLQSKNALKINTRHCLDGVVIIYKYCVFDV